MADQAADAGRLEGQRVALTGRLASMSRAQAIDLIQNCGGEWHPSVRSDTSMLIVGQDGWPLRKDGRLTAKLHKARAPRRTKPIAILTESEFLALVGSESAGQPLGRLSTAELSQILNVPGDRIRGWVRFGLVQPVETTHGVHYFDFRQVSWAKTLSDFVSSGVAPLRIRRSLEQLRRWLPGVDEPLAQLAVLENDRQMLVRLQQGQLAEPSGQGVFEFSDDSLPSTVRVVAEKSAEEWARIGQAHEQTGELGQAADAYRQALRTGGPQADISFNLANVLYAQGRREQAVERYYQVLELDTGFVEAWNNLGIIFVELEEHDDAIAAFEKVLELNPLYVDAHYNLADTLDDVGRVRDAVSHWQAYVRHDPASPWGKYARRRLSEMERQSGA